MQMSGETQNVDSVRQKRLLQDSDNHIQKGTASQAIRTKYESVTPVTWEEFWLDII
jgi:hypothetical protein